ncbi:MAG: type II toxin-antitoxin system VapC family toxin [Verrucomicrobiales bacterium]|nr:type II toxin-antitoxin system VapC family toxin [Verrucomicrobiales bacterium]
MMTLIDSNILIDIWTQDPTWKQWSSDAFAKCLADGDVGINPVIYSEISLGFATESDVEAAVKMAGLTKLQLPFSAAFSAGRAFQLYRKRGGTRTSTLPDFLIGAHSEVANISLLTRDPSGYRSYFPNITLISP